MASDIYPLTVSADCSHSMVVRDATQQEAFEADHRERCGATEFHEQIDNSRF